MLYTEIQVHCLSLVFCMIQQNRNLKHDTRPFLLYDLVILLLFILGFVLRLLLQIFEFISHFSGCFNLSLIFNENRTKKVFFCEFLAHQNNLLCTCDIFSGNNIIHSVFFRSFNNLNKFSLRVELMLKKEACAQPLGPLIEYLS